MAVSADEGLEAQAELLGQILFADRAQERDGGLIGLELRETAGAFREVLLQLLVDLRRELVLDVVRQEAHDVSATAHHETLNVER
jgi:hypothetical protein